MTDHWTVNTKPGRYHLRLTLNERLQHVVLMLSIFTLIATGMPVRFHEVPTADLVVQWMGGNPMRATLHRLAAITLILLTLYHLLYIVLSPHGREQFRMLLAGKQDLLHFWHMLKFYLGLSRTKPAFGRFSYIEKFEYWAVAWGVVIMGLTGLMLWFPTTTMLILPKWALDIARVIHSYEALLAFISIILWHFYNVHFNPSTFPMSTVWIDGLISEEQMKEEHSVEYEKMASQEDEWIWVLPPAVAQPELEAAGTGRGVQPERTDVVNVFASAWGGTLAGAAALMLVVPLIALGAWLLNPGENGWSVALRLSSLLIVPSCATGVTLSVALSMRGQRATQSVFASLASLLSFYLSALALWLTLAAMLYVLQWFFPLIRVTERIATGLLVVSLLAGLGGAIWAVGRWRNSATTGKKTGNPQHSSRLDRIPFENAGAEQRNEDKAN